MSECLDRNFNQSIRVKACVSVHVLIVDQPMPAANNAELHILLARLAYKDHRANKWSFPGGYVDQGETLQIALQREVAEEIDLKLGHCRFIETIPQLQIECPNIGFIFLCDDWTGSPKVKSHEIKEIAWVNEATFWKLDQESQLAYPLMRDQTVCLGWRPPTS